MKKINLIIAKKYSHYLQGAVDVGSSSNVKLQLAIVKGEPDGYSNTGWFLTVIAEDTIRQMSLEYDNPQDDCYIDANGLSLFVYPAQLSSELHSKKIAFLDGLVVLEDL